MPIAHERGARTTTGVTVKGGAFYARLTPHISLSIIRPFLRFYRPRRDKDSGTVLLLRYWDRQHTEHSGNDFLKQFETLLPK